MQNQGFRALFRIRLPPHTTLKKFSAPLRLPSYIKQQNIRVHDKNVDSKIACKLTDLIEMLKLKMSGTKLIHHCYSGFPHEGGGITTYVQTMLNHRSLDVSDRVLTSLKDIDQSQFKLLHVHGGDLLQHLRGECPVVYTLHNHNSYCPSGTKYLTERKICCDRKMSYMGCVWGHIVDGCGSRRPGNIIQNLRRAYQDMETLKKLKVTVITISEYMRKQLIANGLPPEQTVNLYHGLSASNLFSEPLTQEIHNKQRILFVGRIVPDKGLDWLLRAMTKVDEQIKLDIAGEGWATPRLEILAKDLGISNRVYWHGWCDQEKLDRLYQQSFAIIFPSVWPEPAGLVTLESYRHCRPVIASSVGGVPEYVSDGKTGILVPLNNIEPLAFSINLLSKNYYTAREMGQAGNSLLNHESRFSLNVHFLKLKDIYNLAISRF
jgi:glycosyltransferase involved in cell wall biosynthesis